MSLPDPNCKRKGPPIEVDLFAQAEVYLQPESISPAEAELFHSYRDALQIGEFGKALEFLVQLGELQGCSNPYWRVLERLAIGVWPTQWMVDKRAKGQRETRIAYIQRRARGYA